MSSLHILVAEDNIDHAEMILDALEEFNKENKIEHFSNGDLIVSHLLNLQELENGESSMPDLILMDIKMPIMDGLEALRLIKENPALKHIPIMMVSTSENSLDIEKSYRYGANSYIVKPFDYTEFAKKICEVNHFWADISKLSK
ncbi:response regulator [Alteromonas sp. 14N.309.X.WAT.G.H12]|uniref:response regulator n=1 Tax=Alteromonas sp. 14N.309.X.WAT.G.H12 TaxID=3120824 RepID=UPI002FD021E0